MADETKRRDDLVKQLDRSSGVLVKAKSGVGHLSDKVTHIKVTRGSTPQAKVDVNADEYVLDLLGLCEEKLLKLLDVMQGHDVVVILKKMQREEVSRGLRKAENQRYTIYIIHDLFIRKK